MATLTTDCPDAELLREFVQRRSDAAFHELTQRHVNLVFGTAFRATNDATAAEEIVQNVFLILAKKALWLQREGSLAAWLHRVALMESKQWWRGELRRRQREQTAFELETTMKTTTQTEPAMSAVLDEALLELREADRQVVLLRYFEGRNHREIGAALGIGEDTARKRVDRAMEQLLAFFRQRGFAVGSAAMLVAFLTGATQAAPANLAAKVSAAALAAGGGLTLPWLVKLLGLGRMRLAVGCLMTVLLPFAWQQTRLGAAQAEQARIQALLTQVQTQRAGVADELAQVRRQLAQATNDLAMASASRLSPAGTTGADNLDPRLFLWDEAADYVRLPKAILDELPFDGETPNAAEGKTRVIGTNGLLSVTLLDVLGLKGEERERLQTYFSEGVSLYATFANERAELHGVEALPPGVPDFVKTNEHTRVWYIPKMPEAAAQWRAAFTQGLEELTGKERARIILRQAAQDFSLHRVFQNFGTTQPMIVVTPLLSGGCAIANSYSPEKNWWHGTSLAISQVIGQYNWLPDFLGRPVPAPLISYLQQWQQTHPEVPDKKSQP